MHHLHYICTMRGYIRFFYCNLSLWCLNHSVLVSSSWIPLRSAWRTNINSSRTRTRGRQSDETWPREEDHGWCLVDEKSGPLGSSTHHLFYPVIRETCFHLLLSAFRFVGVPTVLCCAKTHQRAHNIKCFVNTIIVPQFSTSFSSTQPQK